MQFDYKSWKKLLFVPFLYVVACVIAGIYGGLHDQISYTVSEEYFTNYKFYQFHIDPNLQGRIGVGIVGWCAAWWMGILVGFFVITYGLIIPGIKRYIIITIKALGVAALTALIIGLCALLISFITVNSDNAGQHIKYGNVIIDSVAFRRVGIMHKFGYFGGFAGIISAIVYITMKYKAIKTLAE